MCGTDRFMQFLVLDNFSPVCSHGGWEDVEPLNKKASMDSGGKYRDQDVKGQGIQGMFGSIRNTFYILSELM